MEFEQTPHNRVRRIPQRGQYTLPIWAGVLPLQQSALPPVSDPQLAPGIATPEYLVHYRCPG